MIHLLPKGNPVNAKKAVVLKSKLFDSIFCRLLTPNCNRLEKHCDDCKSLYTTERVHWAVCGRKEVPCVYPDENSECGVQKIILHRGVDGHFKCIRCGKLIKKDQNMMVSCCANKTRTNSHLHQSHAKKCMTTTATVSLFSDCIWER